MAYGGAGFIVVWFLWGLLAVVALIMALETRRKVNLIQQVKTLQDRYGEDLSIEALHNHNVLEKAVEQLSGRNLQAQWTLFGAPIDQGDFISFRTRRGETLRGIFIGVVNNPRLPQKYLCCILKFQIRQAEISGFVESSATYVPLDSIDPNSIFSRQELSTLTKQSG